MGRFALSALFLLVVLSLCPPLARAQANPPFLLGIDVFMAGYTGMVKGARVGLVTNQTGKNSAGVPTIDLLYRHPGIKLVALFSPEHGIRGTALAGAHVEDGRDARTGLPVYSLYGGKDHRPTAASLATIDIMIFDIQDVGSRAYTYIWSLAEVIAACGIAGKPVIILDRPNPLGGLVIDGPTTEPKWKSFLGLYPIPRVHGMTVGELGRYFNAEHDLHCKVVVIPMAGWSRASTWRNTGLTWTASSPNIPTPEAAVGFAATGTIGTLGFMHIGLGTTTPFQFVGTGWINPTDAAATLNAQRLPGVTFLPLSFVATTGGMKGEVVNAVYLRVDDPARFLPTTTEVAMLQYLQVRYPTKFKWPPKTFDSFDKAMGTSDVRLGLARGMSWQQLNAQWQPSIDAFRARRARYLIYQ